MDTNSNFIEINHTKIGQNQPCYIIAEIGINHNGNLDLAKKLIDVAVSSGANAVKFQKRTLNELYKEDSLSNPNIESQGFEILVDILNEVEFGESEFTEIIDYCSKKQITFLCTPWDIESVNFLEKFNVPAYKVASADLTNLPLLKYLTSLKKPLIISTGMSEMFEIEKTVQFLKNHNSNFVLLHSNSTYPAPIDSLNLNLIPELFKKFSIPIGYSGHENDIIPSLTAANLGAVIVERHITLDKTMPGIDQSSSLEPLQFKNLVSFIRESEKAKGKAIKHLTRGEFLQRELLGKSLVCKTNIKIDEIFTEKNIHVIGPAKGISPQYFYELLGRKSKKQFKKGDYIQIDDL